MENLSAQISAFGELEKEFIKCTAGSHFVSALLSNQPINAQSADDSATNKINSSTLQAMNKLLIEQENQSKIANTRSEESSEVERLQGVLKALEDEENRLQRGLTEKLHRKAAILKETEELSTKYSSNVREKEDQSDKDVLLRSLEASNAAEVAQGEGKCAK